MDSPLDARNAAMLKKGFKTLNNEQLAFALDAGVRILEAWRLPVPIRPSMPTDSPNATPLC